MHVEMRKVAHIKPYPHNPRHNDHAVEAVAASIREFGCSGRFRGLSNGEASGALGSGRDGAGTGGAFFGKIVETVPAGA
jgi:hypothetical protein